MQEGREVMMNSIVEAARKLNATPSDIPGLWNAPGYPELTTGQLLSVAGKSVEQTPAFINAVASRVFG